MTQVNQLSKREWEVVDLLLQGKSNKLIALSLGISDRTVEFHLKNVYAKFQVNSRIELILKLGNATGNAKKEQLGYSTVARLGKNTENRGRLNSRIDWATSFRDTVSMIGKELEMKNIFNTKHVLVGVITALFAGCLWAAMLIYSGGNMPNLETGVPMIVVLRNTPIFSEFGVPMIIVLPIIGLSVGFVGKRNGNTLQKVFFSTLSGAALSPFMVIPLMLAVVLPIGYFAEWLGLIDPATMSRDVATTLTMIAMTAIWLVVGVTIGIVLLFVTIKKPEQKVIQPQVSERGL